ncbi:MAG: TIGR03960 family B12-binding radical SAM protein [Desulfovibrionaceae bacterium]|nr:TIGR03960 family B12-binding radical SAM protein [Desulfovibrionaceae bacterium]
MRHLLPILPRPSRYLGIEEGSVHKDISKVKLHIALAFPDLYEVAMSYLGQKILYAIINSRPAWYAERAFTPCREAAGLLRRHGVPLASLESDTPLADFDLIGFSVTHELCYTNILMMLDLAGIPFRSVQRDESHPIILAGGGCTMACEPLAPFMDMMILGEAEECAPKLLQLVEQAKTSGWTRPRLLEEAVKINGVYVPQLQGPDAPARAVPRPTRQIVRDLNDALYPETQAVPFGAVHNRLALEIARGCTRGCRFCQAGMIYRPARERRVDNLVKLTRECLNATGYDDISFLSLSTGDFSALKTLFLQTSDRCAQEQVSVSLPSLRVGSIDSEIMNRMAGIRRTGATLAPEAGSQRLRDVINKGVTEEAILTHARKLFEHGWQQIKLYFMIGLPTETDADLDAAVELCRKVRDAAGKGVRRLQVTGAFSTFVPKPHTPFQWEAQISLSEIERRISYLLERFKAEKNLKMRWHEPKMSFLEGIMSRGDRRLSNVVESAYRNGDIFTAWIDEFSIDPWLAALAEHGLDPEIYTGPRDLKAPLPWEHIENGVSREFLLRERARAFAGQISPDCRYAACQACGVCDRPGASSSILNAAVYPEPASAQNSADNQHGSALPIQNILNFAERDQLEYAEQEQASAADNAPQPGAASAAASETGKNKPPAIAAELTHKEAIYRIWYSKSGAAVYLSQLELQPVMERALRRASLPLSFSQGFHPLPLLTFGRALPVGVESRCEWFAITLSERRDVNSLRKNLAKSLPRGLEILYIEELPVQRCLPQAVSESYLLSLTPQSSLNWEKFAACWRSFAQEKSRIWTRETKKGPRTDDLRKFFRTISIDEQKIEIIFDWREKYVSPLTLCLAAIPETDILDLHLIKISQKLGFAEQD